MPEITPTTTLVPIINPQAIFNTENFFYEEPFGSRDTYLSRLFNGGYDMYYVPYWSQRDQRYANQGLVNTLGHFALNLGMDFVAEGILRPAAALSSLAFSPLAGLANLVSSKPITFADIVGKNPLNLLADGVQNLSAEWAPLFTQEGFEDLTLAEQLRSPGQYLLSNAEAISYLTSFIGVMGIGARLGGALTQKLLVPALLQAGKVPPAQLLNATEFITANALSTITESSVEAQEVHKRIVAHHEKLAQAYPNEFAEVADVAKQRADNAFTNVFALNAITLGITNSILGKMLAPALRKLNIAGLDDAYQFTVGRDAFLQKEFTSPLARFFFDKGNPAGMLTKGILIESANNALEENLQYTYGKIHEQVMKPLDFTEALSSAFKDFINQDLLNEQERLKSTFLGGLLGGGSIVGASLLGAGPYQQAKAFASEQEQILETLNKQYTDFTAVYNKITSADLYERTPSDTFSFKPSNDGKLKMYKVEGSQETFVRDVTVEEAEQIRQSGKVNQDNTVTVGGQIVLDENQNPVLNPSKLAAFLRDNAILQEVFDEINAAMTAQKSPEVITYLTNKALTPLVLQSYLSHSTEALKAKLRGLLALEVGDKTAVQNRINEINSYIDSLSSVFKKVNDYIYTLENTEETQQLNSKHKQLAFSIGAMLVNLENLRKNLQDKLDSFSLDANFMKAVEELINEGKVSKKTADSIVGQYDMQQVGEVAEAANSVKDLNKTIEQLKKDFDGLINPRSRHKTFDDVSSRKVVKGATGFVLGMSKEDYATVKKQGIRSLMRGSVNRVLRALLNTRMLEDVLDNITAESDSVNFDVASAGKLVDSLHTLIKQALLAGARVDKALLDKISNLLAKLNYVIESALVEADKLGFREAIEAEDPNVIHFASSAEEESTIVLAQSAWRVKKLADAILADLAAAPSERKFETLNEQQAEEGFIDNMLNPLELIVKLAQEEDFLDLPSIGFVEQYLTELAKVEEHPRVEQLLARATKAKVKVAERLAKKEQEDLMQAIESTNALGNILPLLEEQTAAAIDKAIKEDPVLGYFLAMDFVSAKEAREALEKLKAKLGVPLYWATQTVMEFIANKVGYTNSETYALHALYLEGAYDKFLSEAKKKLSAADFKTLEQLLQYSSSIDFLKLVSSLNEDVKVSTLLKNVYEYFSSKQVVPTIAQTFAILQLATFSLAETSHLVFEDVAALRSPAGAGKTSMVIPSMLVALGYGIDDVVAFASTPLATELVRKQIPTSHKVGNVQELVEHLDNDTLPKTVKLVILDEAGGLTRDEINNLTAAISRYNQKGNNLKVLLFYDQAQTGLGQVGLIQLDSHTIPNGSGDVDAAMKGVIQSRLFYPATPFGIRHIFRAAPLNVSFRASSLEITTLAKEFRLGMLEKLTTVSNVEPGRPVKEIPYGTLVVHDRNSAISLINAAIALDPTRSRLVVVSDEATKRAYESVFDPEKVKVVLIGEARGIAADEVYVELQKGNLRDQAFAKQMYTAITRGVSFVTLVGPYNYSHTVDADIKNRHMVTSATKIVSKGRMELLEKSAKAAEKLGLITVKKKTNDGKDDDDKDDNDDGGEDDSDGPGDDEKFFIPKHPASEYFNVDTADITSDDIYIAKTDEGGGRYFVRVMAKDDSNDFYTLAILNEEEMSRFSVFSGVKVDKLPVLEYAKVPSKDPTGKVVITFVGGFPKQVTTVRFSEARSHPLMFTYLEEERTIGGVEDLRALVKKVLDAYWGGNAPDDLLTDEALQESVSIKAYATDREVAQDFKHLPAEKRPRKNRPYLVIKGVRSPAGKTLPNLFVPLKATAATAEHTSAIRELIPLLEEFESLVKHLPHPYSQVRIGVADKDGYSIAHALIVKLAELAKMSPGSQVKFVPDKDAKGTMAKFVPLKYDEVPPKLLEVATKIVELLHGTEGGFRGKGLAQQEFDSLAKTNLMVNTASGKLMILRDYDYVSKDKDVVSTGMSILGPVKFYMGSGVPYLKRINAALRERLIAYIDSLSRRGKEGSARFKLILDALNSVDTTHNTYFSYTVSDLKELFIDSLDENGTYSNVSEGFALRAFFPRRMDIPFSETVEGQFSHDIAEVYPTQIVIAKTTVGDSESGPTVPPVRVRTTDDGTLSPHAIQAYIKKIISLSSTIEEALQIATNYLSKFSTGQIREALELLASQVTALTDLDAYTSEQLLAESVYDYYNKSRQGITKTTVKRIPITQMLRTLAAMPETNRATHAIENSPIVVEVGNQAGQYAARDFIRAAVLTDVLGISLENSTQLFGILSIARAMPSTIVQEHLLKEAIATLTNLTLEEIYLRANKVFAEYSSALIKKGVVITPSQVNSLEALLQQLETIVQATSAYRTSLRKQAENEDRLARLKEDLQKALDLGAVDEFFASYSQTLDDLGLPKELEALVSTLGILDESPFTSEIDPVFDMTEEEAQRYAEKMIPKSFKDLITNIFTKRVPSIVLRFMDFGKLQTSKGRRAYGIYKRGVITLMKSVDNFVSKHVLRHEIFHKLFWEYLTTEERLKVLTLAREQYGNLSSQALEEKMAEDFARYERKRGLLQALKDLFNHLLKLLGFTYKNFSTMEDLFYAMDAGLLTKRSDPLRGERPMLFIPTRFSSIEAFDVARKEFIDTFQQTLESKNPVYSFDEAVIKTIETLRDTVYEDEFTATAVKTLLEPEVLNGFLQKYFGSTYIRQAKKRFDTEALRIRQDEILSQLESLEESIDEQSEEFPDEYFELQDELSSIRDELMDSDTIDPEETLSARVKQRLANISYTYKGQRRYIDVTTAFNLLLPLASGISAMSLEDYVTQLSKKLHSVSGGKAVGVRGTIAKHVNKLLDRVALAVARPINKRVSFRRDVFSEDFYVLVSKTKDVRPMTLQEAIKDPEVIVHHLEGLTMDSLVKEILASLKGLTFELPNGKTRQVSYEDVAEAYQDFEAINFAIGLHFATASTYRRRPMVGVEERKYGRYRSGYYEIRTQASRRIDESRVAQFLKNFVKDHQDRLEEVKESLAVFQTETRQMSPKAREAVVSFLKALSFTDSLIASIDDKALIGIGTTAYWALRDIIAELSTPNMEDEDLAPKSISAAVDDQGSLIAAIAEAANTAAKLVEAHSYRKGGGQTAFAYTNASLQHEKGTQITHGTTDGHTRVEGGKIITEDPLLKNSIFSVKGPGVLYGHVVHDSMKTRGGSAVSVFKRENLLKIDRRNFVHGLLDTFYQSRGQYYVQFLPVPASRKNIEGFQVRFLSEKEADRAILMILQNQASRPQFNDPTYAKNREYYFFAGLGDRIKTSSLTPQKALERIKKHLDAQAELLAQMWGFDTDKPLSLQIEKVDFLARKMNLYNKGEKTLDVLKGELIDIYRSANRTKEQVDAKKAQIKAKTYEVARRIIRLFLHNYVTNLYGLSEWIYGDPAFYSSKENLTKRIQIATSPGYRPLIDNIYGVPSTLRVLYFKDPVVKVGDEVDKALSYTREAEVEITDSNAYMLPETYERFARASSIEFKNDVIVKPVYAGFEVGTFARKQLKFSVVVLTDDFVAKFPKWAKIRDLMRAHKADFFVPKSAAKVGSPSVLLSVDRKGNVLNAHEASKALSTIDSRFIRINLNLAKEVDSETIFPVQAPAVINSSGLNTPQTWQTYILQGKIIEMGRRAVTRELRLTQKGTASTRTLRILRDKLIRAAKELPGYEDVYYLLETDDTKSVSINLPVIADKMVSLLASSISRSTVTIRMKGSKLVLQSDFGTYEYIDEDGKLRQRILQYKDNANLTEAFVPKQYHEMLSASQGKAVAFRIPISNFHSILGLTSMGSYPVPPASHGNMIIPSSMIVYFQGSDNDGDTLFTIIPEALDESIDLSDIVSAYDPSFPRDVKLEAGELYGLKDGDILRVNGQNIVFALDKVIRDLDSQLAFFRRELAHAKTAREKVFLNMQIQAIVATLDRVERYVIKAAKNQIIHIYSQTLQRDTSIPELLTPITFVQVNATQKDTSKLKESGLIRFEEGWLDDIDSIGTAHLWYALEMMRSGGSGSFTASLEEIEKVLYPIGHFNDYITQREIKRNSDAGSTGIGIIANTLKSLGMLLESTDPVEIVDEEGQQVEPTYENSLVPSNQVLRREPIRVKPDYRIKIDSHEYSELTRVVTNVRGEEVTFFDGKLNTFMTLDTLENLAIDEIKEGRMFILGINTANAAAFLSAIIMGVPLNVVSLIFKHPKISSLYSTNYVNEVYLNSVIEPITETTLSRQQLEEFFSVSSLEDLKDGRISLRYLIGAYTGQLGVVHPDPDVASEILRLHEFILLHNLKKLVVLGRQFFYISSTLSLLKKIPGVKTEMDAIYARITELYDFSAFDRTEKTYEALKTAAEVYLRNVSDNVEKDLREFTSSKVFKTFVEDVAKSASVNAAIRSGSFELTQPSEENVLENGNILRLPQVGAAVSTLLFTMRVVEEAFPLYSPYTRELAENILKRSDMYYIPKDFYGKVRFIQGALFRALTSNLTLRIYNQDVPLFFGKETTYKDKDGIEYEGNEAFARKFEDTVFNIRLIQELLNENEFLSALEFSSGRIGISMDKLKNEEITERIRRAYLDLWENDPQLALDFFRYAVITSGLFFSRTSFARVFPWELTHLYSRALSERLESIFSKDNPITTRVILRAVEDTVLLQFVRRMKDNLSYVPVSGNTIPFVTGRREIRKKTEDAHQGYEVIDQGGVSSTIYYDLKFLNPKSAPRFIRRWATDPHVYMKLDVDSPHAYYRIVGAASDITFEVDTLNTANNTDLDKLSRPGVHVIPSSNFIARDVIYYPQNMPLKEGHIFYVLNLGQSIPTKLVGWKVVKVLHDGKYQVRPIGQVVDISIQDKFDAEYSGSEILSYVSYVPDVLIATARQAVEAVLDKGDGYSITSSTDDVEGDFVLPLDWKEGMDSTEFLAKVADVVKQIPRLLKGRTKLYVASTILDDLIAKNKPLAQAVARIMFDYTRWVHPILREVLTLEEVGEFDRTFRLVSMIDYKVTVDTQVVSTDLPGKLRIPLNRLAKISPRAVTLVEKGALLMLNDGNFAYVLDIDDKAVTAVVLTMEQASRLPDRITPRSVFEKIIGEEIKKYCS